MPEEQGPTTAPEEDIDITTKRPAIKLVPAGNEEELDDTARRPAMKVPHTEQVTSVSRSKIPASRRRRQQKRRKVQPGSKIASISDIVDTPLLVSEDEPWVEVITPIPAELLTPAPPLISKGLQVREHVRIIRRVLVAVLLILLIACCASLWGDITDTHLYISTVDARDGQVLGQQDVGGGYSGRTLITEPVQVQSSLFASIRTSQGKQQILELMEQPSQDEQKASGTRSIESLPWTVLSHSWGTTHQFSTSFTVGTISATPNGYLVVGNADGLQVMTTSGRALWSIQGKLPALGEHHFQPAFDGTTLYTLQSTKTGQVAAYDLQSGVVRWTQALDDTFNYAPPFLLNKDTLYIAGDYKLYALNSADGKILWKVSQPARTLLMLYTGTGTFLVTAGAQGLTALDAATGAVIWSFKGQSIPSIEVGAGSLTTAQFYQASAGANNIIYTTGIVWDAQQVREQLWLYAVDGFTGHLRWSEHIGSGFISADGGRVFPPLVDTASGLVILQQASDYQGRILAAYDATSGVLRWSRHYDGVTALTSSLIEPRDELILLNIQSNPMTALSSWSPLRMLLLVIMGLSLVGLLLLWVLAFRSREYRLRVGHAVGMGNNGAKTLGSAFGRIIESAWFIKGGNRVRGRPKGPLPAPLLSRPYGRDQSGPYGYERALKLFALILLVLLGAGLLLYMQLRSPQNGSYEVTSSTGSLEWQHIPASSISVVKTDAQGSIASVTIGENLHELLGLNSNGTSRWTTFPSEGMFSLPLPKASILPDTTLVALSGHTKLNYQFAPDDPAYFHPLDSLLTLYLLKRSTGDILWQSTIVHAGAQEHAVLLNADANSIYVGSVPIYGSSRTVQLIAIDAATGNIEWRIFGPKEAYNTAPDTGTLLLQGRMITWQVAGIRYGIDAEAGQISWRQSIEDNKSN